MLLHHQTQTETHLAEAIKWPVSDGCVILILHPWHSSKFLHLNY